MAETTEETIRKQSVQIQKYVTDLKDSADTWLGNTKNIIETGKLTGGDGTVVLTPNLPDIPSEFDTWKPALASIVPRPISKSWSDYTTAIGEFNPTFEFDADYWLRSTINRYDSTYLSDLETKCQDLLGNILASTQNADGTFNVSLGADGFSELTSTFFGDIGVLSYLRTEQDTHATTLRTETEDMAARVFSSIGYSMPTGFSTGLVAGAVNANDINTTDRHRILVKKLSRAMQQTIQTSIDVGMNIEDIRARGTVEYAAMYKQLAAAEINKQRIDLKGAVDRFTYNLATYQIDLSAFQLDESFTRYKVKTDMSEQLAGIDRDYQAAMNTFKAATYDLRRDISTAEEMVSTYAESLTSALETLTTITTNNVAVEG